MSDTFAAVDRSLRYSARPQGWLSSTNLLSSFMVMMLAANWAAADITWVVPEDGGTPRDTNRITLVSAREFHIAARAEEGSGPLSHAVSRLDLLCRNTGTKPVEVVLHLDLSDDGRRTNRDAVPWGDMPRRDFLYIQSPQQLWQRVEGSVTGWVCTVRFAAAVGDTKVGLSPWYQYGDYLRWVESLAEHPHLRKVHLNQSDGGRAHWELVITDPSVPAERKRRIFWHAREHAYETFSSFAMEGLVAWLLSTEANTTRQQFELVLHPMTNVDGVAQGYEYRGGYDFPQPRGTATARLTFGALDRLQPHFALAWHNWIAPRATDALFYTDSQAGRASRRAWDLFTQHFPSPRGVGHRWKSETEPLSENWFGRKLNESNPHQYAMKRYGTQIWGWEMPWWGRDDGDPTQQARKAGADFGRAFFATLARIESDDTSADFAKSAPQNAPAIAAKSPSAKPPEVARWSMHEFELHGLSHVENPFRDAALVGEFTAPSGKKRVVEGFHDRDDTWRLRFAPDEEGLWHYLLRGEGVELFERGQLFCITPPPAPVNAASTRADFANSAPVTAAKSEMANRQSPINNRLETAFTMIREAVAQGEVPGAIALVAHQGRIIRHEAFGLGDPERQIPFRTNTLCWIASITKPLTVATAMTLVDAGQVSLDDLVEKYLPEFRQQQHTNGTHQAITIRHLMTHTSGLVGDPPTRRSGWPIGGALDDSWLTGSLPDIVSAIARSRLLFKPGSQVKYSNSALFVLGRLMEVVSGKPYAQLVQERILNPLGMKDTWYAPPASATNRFAAISAERQGQRYTVFRFKPELKISNTAPDGGLFSYPGELVKFLQLFLDNDGKVLSKAAVREMLQQQFPGWGLGWALEEGCFLHNGSSGTTAFADPQTGVIGILFFQFRDQKDRVSALSKEFRQRVRAAFTP